jgi:FkbM family methyltransferase
MDVDQLRQIQASLSELIANQKLLLRKIDEIANSSATLLAEGRVITRLRTGQLMFVDSRDIGSGFNLITTGYIEPNVAKLLQKTFLPGAVFLDVGANFGFYTVMAGAQVGPAGRIYAFEANPFLIKFIKDNVWINGLSDRITIINKAVSDQSGNAQFKFSFSGIGGGFLSTGEGRTLTDTTDHFIEVPLTRIDDVLPSDLSVDCVKLDIEGAELAALRGMSNVIARSPTIKIVLEFFPKLLSRGSGGAEKVLDALEQVGLGYWRISNRGRLEDVSRDQLVNGGECYLLAGRKKPDDRTLTLSPEALRYPTPTDSEGMLAGAAGSVLVHGPYWYLPSGIYDVELEGEMLGTIEARFSHEFGYVVAARVLHKNNMTFEVSLQNDVRYFEVVLRSMGPESKLKLNRILIKERI